MKLQLKTPLFIIPLLCAAVMLAGQAFSITRNELWHMPILIVLLILAISYFFYKPEISHKLLSVGFVCVIMFMMYYSYTSYTDRHMVYDKNTVRFKRY